MRLLVTNTMTTATTATITTDNRTLAMDAAKASISYVTITKNTKYGRKNAECPLIRLRF
jgi:hypothetical protein